MNFHTKAIIDAIIYRFAYGITEVKDIEEIGSLLAYTDENIQALTAILKQGNYEEVEKLEKAKDVLGEDLTLFRFKDQHENIYYGFYYDSIELTQNPVVMEVFPAL